MILRTIMLFATVAIITTTIRKSGDPRVINEAYPSLFSFNRADLAYKFHKNFKDLLKEASPLLF